MKRVLAIFIAAVLLSLTLPVPCRAAGPYSLIGDADGDGELSILDATRVQRALAGFVGLDTLHTFLADVDGIDGVTILDATGIQRELAGIGGSFYRYRLDHWRAEIASVSSPPMNAPITEGSTVTFRIDEAPHPIPSEYEVYVDGLLERERSADADFSYTFRSAGSYRFSVVAYDPFGGADVYSFEKTAVAAEELYPRITSATYNRNTTILSVIAEGGTAPYEYEYVIRNDIAGPPPGGNYNVTAGSLFEFDTDENTGQYILICKFCEESAVYLPIEALTMTLNYTCEIQVRDAYGNLSEIKKVQIKL